MRYVQRYHTLQICLQGQIQQSQAKQDKTPLVCNCINYLHNVKTPMADILLMKILLSNIISINGAKSMLVDIINFYLNKPLKCPEYIHLQLSDVPEDVINEYKLRHKAT